MPQTPPQLSPKQQLFESMVRTGFDPLRMFIEKKRLEEELSTEDVNKVMRNIEMNVNNWMEWLRHQNSHISSQGRHGHE